MFYLLIYLFIYLFFYLFFYLFIYLFLLFINCSLNLSQCYTEWYAFIGLDVKSSKNEVRANYLGLWAKIADCSENNNEVTNKVYFPDSREKYSC